MVLLQPLILRNISLIFKIFYLGTISIPLPSVAKLDLFEKKLALAHPIVSSSNLIFYRFFYTSNERMDAVYTNEQAPMG